MDLQRLEQGGKEKSSTNRLGETRSNDRPKRAKNKAGTGHTDKYKKKRGAKPP